MTRSTAKPRTAPSAPRQGQRSTTSELSRTRRVRSPVAGKSVFAGEKVQRLHPRARQKKTALPPSVRINPKGQGEYVHTRNTWLVPLTLVVVTLLTSAL